MKLILKMTTDLNVNMGLTVTEKIHNIRKNTNIQQNQDQREGLKTRLRRPKKPKRKMMTGNMTHLLLTMMNQKRILLMTRNLLKNGLQMMMINALSFYSDSIYYKRNR